VVVVMLVVSVVSVISVSRVGRVSREVVLVMLVVCSSRKYGQMYQNTQVEIDTDDGWCWMGGIRLSHSVHYMST